MIAGLVAIGTVVTVADWLNASSAQEGKKEIWQGTERSAQAEQIPAETAPGLRVRPNQAEPQSNSNPYRPDCTNPQPGNEADLCQQIRMAKAAEDTADWTWLQVIGTGLEIALLVVAVFYAGRAAYWAKGAAKAGRDQVDATNETNRLAKISTQVQSRAWVTSTNVLVTKIVGGSNVQRFDVQVHWKNTGPTPATRCQAWIHVILAPSEKDVEALVFSKQEPDAMREAPIGAGMEFPGAIAELPINRMEELVSGKRRMYTWARVEYFDIFNRNTVRHTEITLETIYRGNLTTLRDADDAGQGYFRHTTIGRQNSIS